MIPIVSETQIVEIIFGPTSQKPQTLKEKFSTHHDPTTPSPLPPATKKNMGKFL